MKLTRIKLSDIVAGPVQHMTLPAMLLARIQRLHTVLGDDLCGCGLGEWVEGFQRDLHPEHEVIIWEGIARAIVTFLGLRGGMTMGAGAKRELLGLALAGPQGGPFKHLSPAEAEEFVLVHRQAWAEVRAETGFDQKRAEAMRRLGVG